MIMKASHRAVMVCSESLLFIFLQFIWIIFRIVRRASEQIYVHVINYTLQGVIIIKSLI